MIYLTFTLPILSCMILAAHFSRISNDPLALTCLALPLILLSKKEWIRKIFQVFLVIGGIIWIERTLFLIQMRIKIQQPWIRLTIILGTVSLISFLSAWILNSQRI